MGVCPARMGVAGLYGRSEMTREIALPALDDEQQHVVATILHHIGGTHWLTARVRVRNLPGIVYRSADSEVVDRIRIALVQAGFRPEVRDSPLAALPLWEAPPAQDVGSGEEAVGHPETTSVASSIPAAHPANAFRRPLTVSDARVVAGIVCILLLVLLLGWTEELASAQETGPQILQVYTRSAFYAVCIIGVTFGVYALTRRD